MSRLFTPGVLSQKIQEDIGLKGLDLNEDYIEFPNQSYMNTNNFSVLFWYKRSMIDRAANLFNKRADGNRGYGLSMSNTGVVRWTQFGQSNYDLPITISNLDWNHIAAVKDGSRFRMSINGVQLTDISVTASMLHANDPFRIAVTVTNQGIISGINSNFGSISELRFYSNSLTQAEIQSTYQQQLCAIPSNLSGYWKMDNIVSEEVIDYAGNNNGTVIGNPTVVTDPNIILTPC